MPSSQYSFRRIARLRSDHGDVDRARCAWLCSAIARSSSRSIDSRGTSSSSVAARGVDGADRLAELRDLGLAEALVAHHQRVQRDQERDLLPRHLRAGRGRPTG